MNPPRSDQDSPWKDILRQYFREALEFFFPNTAALIDWHQPWEFLDKEFQQIAPDAEVGKRYADQLIKVHRQRGKTIFLLLHVEIQAHPEANFAKRMLTYALRIFDRFDQHAVSLAILCDARANWRPQHYHFAMADTELTFRFGIVKLLDYQTRWAELEQSQNPFATVVMAHVKAQETRKNLRDRKEWKLALIRRLYEQGYDRSRILNLFKFIDWLMILPEGLTQEFWTELRTYEEERKVPYITSVERIGFQRGVKAGREEVRQEMALNLLREGMAIAAVARVTGLEISQIEQLQTTLTPNSDV